MFFDEKIDETIEILKRDSFFDDMRIIKAYPCATKPTRLEKNIIAVSPGETVMNNISVGQCVLYGNYEIRFDIFVSQRNGAESLAKIASRIIHDSLFKHPAKIEVSNTSAYNAIGAFTLRCTLTFAGKDLI